MCVALSPCVCGRFCVIGVIGILFIFALVIL